MDDATLVGMLCGAQRPVCKPLRRTSGVPMPGSMTNFLSTRKSDMAYRYLYDKLW
jgi:hypothetical protein